MPKLGFNLRPFAAASCFAVALAVFGSVGFAADVQAPKATDEAFRLKSPGGTTREGTESSIDTLEPAASPFPSITVSVDSCVRMRVIVGETDGKRKLAADAFLICPMQMKKLTGETFLALCQHQQTSEGAKPIGCLAPAEAEGNDDSLLSTSNLQKQAEILTPQIGAWQGMNEFYQGTRHSDRRVHVIQQLDVGAAGQNVIIIDSTPERDFQKNRNHSSCEEQCRKVEITTDNIKKQ